MRRPRREDDARRHRLAVQPGSVAGARLDRVPERVSEVEQGPGAGFALVGHHQRGLALARPHHREAQRIGVEAEQGRHVGFEPVEETGVVDEPVLHDLGEARPDFAGIEGRKRRGVADHAPGLVEGADEVLAAGQVHAGLAAHGGVHLGEQRGRHLQEIDTPLVAGGGEPGNVADDPSAERDDDPVACDPPRGQGALDLREGVQGLVLLAIGNDVRIDGGGIREGGAQPVEIEGSDGLAGDHEDVPIADVRSEQPSLADDPRPDVDWVAPGPQVDLDGADHSASMRRRISLSAKRLDRCVDLTTMSALPRYRGSRMRMISRIVAFGSAVCINGR